jgi:hypothetical protein
LEGAVTDKTAPTPTIEIGLKMSPRHVERVQRLARASGRSVEDIIAEALGRYFASMPELPETAPAAL